MAVLQLLDRRAHGHRLVQLARHGQGFFQLDQPGQRLLDDLRHEFVHLRHLLRLELPERLRLAHEIALRERVVLRQPLPLRAHRQRAFEIAGLLQRRLQFAQRVLVFPEHVALHARDLLLALQRLALAEIHSRRSRGG